MAQSKDDSSKQGEGFSAPGITDLPQRLSRALGEAVKGPTRIFSSAAGELANAAVNAGLAGADRGVSDDSSGKRAGYQFGRSAESLARVAGSVIVETAHVVEDTAEVFVHPIGYGAPDFVKTGNRLYPMSPHILEDVTLHAFFPEVNQKKLQDYLDKVFKEPTGGAVQLRPACRRLVIFAADMKRVATGNSDEERRGHTSDIDVAMWAFAIRTKPIELPKLVYFVPLYHFVGKAPTLAAGREIFGFPKQDAEFGGILVPESARSESEAPGEEPGRDEIIQDVLTQLYDWGREYLQRMGDESSGKELEDRWCEMLDEIARTTMDGRSERPDEEPGTDAGDRPKSVELLNIRPWTLVKNGDESVELKRETVVRITGGVPQYDEEGLDVETLFKTLIDECLQEGSLIKRVFEELGLGCKTDDILRLLGIDPKNFVHGRIPMLFLKQVPSAENSAKCAYQAVVEGTISVKKLGAHGTYSDDNLHLEFPGPAGKEYYPTHPFDEIGGDSEELSKRVFWMKESTLRLEDGKVIWHWPL